MGVRSVQLLRLEASRQHLWVTLQPLGPGPELRGSRVRQGPQCLVPLFLRAWWGVPRLCTQHSGDAQLWASKDRAESQLSFN